MKIITNVSGDLCDMFEHGPPAIALGLMKALIIPIKLPGLIVKSAYQEYHLAGYKLRKIKEWAKAAPDSKIKPWGR